jgi:ribosomal RNA-processing protein 9
LRCSPTTAWYERTNERRKRLDSNSQQQAFSGAKDASVLSWDVETGQKTIISKGARGKKGVKGHTDQVRQCLATSTPPPAQVLGVAANERYVVSGGKDKRICVWDPRSGSIAHVFENRNCHRAGVSCLAFRQDSQTLFSGSLDRTVKIWNLDNMAYVETLFGHQHEITAVDRSGAPAPPSSLSTNPRSSSQPS